MIVEICRFMYKLICDFAEHNIAKIIGTLYRLFVCFCFFLHHRRLYIHYFSKESLWLKTCDIFCITLLCFEMNRHSSWCLQVKTWMFVGTVISFFPLTRRSKCFTVTAWLLSWLSVCITVPKPPQQTTFWLSW